MATKSAGSEEMKLGIDFDKFEEEVEKEIDEMFVPFMSSSPEEESEEAVPVKAEEESKAPVHEGARNVEMADARKEEQPLDLPPLTVEIEEPMSIESSSVESRETTEMESLLNAFNVAYLSLDWDFTAENLSSLNLSLGRLEPYCQKQQQIFSLYKVLKAVIHRLSTKPDSASASLTEIIRTGQDLLQRMLRSKDGPAAAEKDELRSLLKQVQFLKEQTSPKEEMRSQYNEVDERKPLSLVKPAAKPAMPAMAADAEMPAPKGLGEWIANYRSHFSQTFDLIQEENRRLLMLEEILEKKPALAPLTSRLNKIRSALEMHIESFRKKENEFLDGIGLFSQLDGISAEAIGDESMLRDLDSIADSDAEILKKASPVNEAEMQREQVCMFSIADKKVGVSASHVVKTEKIAAGKLKKIMGRGYATLGDFKPLFKNLRTGLYGAWIGLPTDVLKGYRFIPLSRELLGCSSEDPSNVSRVILVSNGRQHGMILTESDTIDLHNEMVCKIAGRDGLLGVVNAGESSSVEILDLDSILKKVQQE